MKIKYQEQRKQIREVLGKGATEMVQHLFAHPVTSPIQMSKDLGIHYTTASRYLQALKKSGLLKDKQIAHRNSANEAVWNKLIEGKDNNAKIKYLITGTISYKQGSVLEKTGAENDFKLTFP